MIAGTIISRYVFREMLVPFGLCVLFFTFLFLMAEMIRVVNWIVNFNVSLASVCAAILFTIPFLLTFVLPMSIMVAVLLTFLRLSTDNEIIALKSCGHGIFKLLKPVLLFGLIGAGMTLMLTLYAVPWGKGALEILTYRVAASNISIGLQERTFNDSFKDLILYVNQIDRRQHQMKDIFIEDKRQPDVVVTVVAPSGKLLSNPEALKLQLQLFDGTIYQTNLGERSSNAIYFHTYNMNLDLRELVEEVEKPKYRHRESLNIKELRERIDVFDESHPGKNRARMTLHRRFAIPAACIVLAFLALPLGIQARATKPFLSMLLGIFFFLLYYLLLSAGYTFGERGHIPAAVSMWLPNAVMLTVGLYFLIQTAREKSLIISLLMRLLSRITAGGFRLDR
jgi:lipopolysaccharide export system permease protein